MPDQRRRHTRFGKRTGRGGGDHLVDLLGQVPFRDSEASRCVVEDDPGQNPYVVVVQHYGFVGVLLGVHDGAGNPEHFGQRLQLATAARSVAQQSGADQLHVHNAVTLTIMLASRWPSGPGPRVSAGSSEDEAASLDCIHENPRCRACTRLHDPHKAQRSSDGAGSLLGLFWDFRLHQQARARNKRKVISAGQHPLATHRRRSQSWLVSPGTFDVASAAAPPPTCRSAGQGGVRRPPWEAFVSHAYHLLVLEYGRSSRCSRERRPQDELSGDGPRSFSMEASSSLMASRGRRGPHASTRRE